MPLILSIMIALAVFFFGDPDTSTLFFTIAIGYLASAVDNELERHQRTNEYNFHAIESLKIRVSKLEGKVWKLKHGNKLAWDVLDEEVDD